MTSHASTSSQTRDAKHGVPASGCAAGTTFRIELPGVGYVGAKITERIVVGSVPLAKNPRAGRGGDGASSTLSSTLPSTAIGGKAGAEI